jgi:hypothetical protein
VADEAGPEPAGVVLGDAAGSPAGQRKAGHELDPARLATHGVDPDGQRPGDDLPDVRAVLRHASIETTGRYLTVRVEDMFDKLQEHYNRPRPQRSYAANYAEADIKVVFGG